MRAKRRGRLSLGLIEGLLSGGARRSEARVPEDAGEERARRHEVAEDAEQQVEQARAPREEPPRQVREAAVADDDLQRARHPLLVARRQAPSAIVAGQRPRRYIAAAERLHRGLHGQLGAPETVEDPLARERIEEAGRVT